MFDYLGEAKSDWLIIDISCVRLNMVKVCNSYVTRQLVEELNKNNSIAIFEELLRERQTDVLNFDKDTFKGLLNRYIDKILELYSEERIIVLDVKHAMTYIGFPNQIKNLRFSTRQELTIQNKRIELAYEILRQRLTKAHYIQSLPTLVGSTNHKWGMSGLHYVDDIYEYFFSAVDYITQTKNKPNEQTQVLGNLFSEYSKKVFEKYSFVVTNYVRECNNIFNFARGIKPGRWESNGVSLTINEDLSFHVKGKAAKETIFYLYSEKAEPLGLWESKKMTLCKGKYEFSTGIKMIKESYYIQLYLNSVNKKNEPKWISCNYSSTFVLQEEYEYLLVRLVINKDSVLDINGYLQLELCA